MIYWWGRSSRGPGNRLRRWASSRSSSYTTIDYLAKNRGCAGAHGTVCAENADKIHHHTQKTRSRQTGYYAVLRFGIHSNTPPPGASCFGDTTPPPPHRLQGQSWDRQTRVLLCRHTRARKCVPRILAIEIAPPAPTSRQLEKKRLA